MERLIKKFMLLFIFIGCLVSFAFFITISSYENIYQLTKKSRTELILS